MTDRCDVAIVGAGPVGLLLGCLLLQRGLDVRVLERRANARSHSRAVGVHPPGLACLSAVGVADDLLARGVRVQSALAYGTRGALGRISFAQLPGPHPFILCVPQSETEQLLRARLCELAPGALQLERELVALEMEADSVRLSWRAHGRTGELRARYLVGCDGKRSIVRASAAIPFRGGGYRQHFLMSDMRDETAFGSTAAVFLTPAGVVESFPLPHGVRRWVVGLGATPRPARAETVARLVYERTGQQPNAATATMESAFQAERYLADRFVHGRIALAGDAAHVLSPIGGQGMNLGWLDAQLLAEALCACLHERHGSSGRGLLAAYGRVRRRAARAATRRAELFMTVGQTRRLATARDFLVAALLSRPLVSHTAQLFTMRGLGPAAA